MVVHRDDQCVICVSDLVCDLVPLHRIRSVLDRIGSDDLLHSLVADAAVRGYLPHLLEYANGGDDGLLGNAVDYRTELDRLVAELEAERRREES